MAKRTCTIDGCVRLCFGHGYCNKHYQRWRRHGDPQQIGPVPPAPPPDGFKTCSRCDGLKPISDFYRDKLRRDGFSSYCKPCVSAYDAASRAKNPRAQKNQSLKWRYGITLDDYERILFKQGGVCAVCKEPNKQIDDRSGNPRMLHVDHDHVTGKVRGLLCALCNTAIGHAGDSPDRLRSLAFYLEAQR